MTKILITAAASLLCLGAAQAADRHEHGVARLDIAIDAKSVTIELETPLENLLGFERAPRNAAEQRQADAMVARLRAADAMFAIDPTAGCKPVRVELTSAVLKLGAPDPQAPKREGHADIDGVFEFDCADASKAGYVDVGLFEFKRMQRLQVQIAGTRGQSTRDLKRPERRIVLTK
jgi:hypothetical protein